MRSSGYIVSWILTVIASQMEFSRKVSAPFSTLQTFRNSQNAAPNQANLKPDKSRDLRSLCDPISSIPSKNSLLSVMRYTLAS